MATVPRRGRFQIHLSTAIVMMFVAGGLIWANVTKQPSRVTRWSELEKTDPMYLDAYGWPCVVKAIVIFETSDGELDWYPMPLGWSIAIDVAVALLILFAVWSVCEWLIRRRAARKGD